MSSEANLSVGFTLADRSIHHLRLMVHGFVLLVTQDSTLAGRATVTCAELAETMTRKVASKACLLRLRVDPRRKVRVEVAVDASDAEAAVLERTIDDSNRETPLSAYTQALANANSGAEADTMLALARIRYEGKMNLRARRQAPQVLVVAESVEPVAAGA